MCLPTCLCVWIEPKTVKCFTLSMYRLIQEACPILLYICAAKNYISIELVDKKSNQGCHDSFLLFLTFTVCLKYED